MSEQEALKAVRDDIDRIDRELLRANCRIQ